MPNTTQSDPATLVAIMVAARRSGDRELERLARMELRDSHGVSVQFARRAKTVEQEATP